MANVATKTAKWTDDDLATLTAGYDAANSEESVKALAAKMGRSHRSVIGKLVSEGLYVKPAAKPAAKRDEGPSKKEILAKIDGLGSFNSEGMEQATKPALQRLYEFLVEVRDERVARS